MSRSIIDLLMQRLSIGRIVLVAICLRLCWIALVAVEPVSDSAAYWVFSRNIVEHGVYGFTPEQPGAYWAVGTSAIYAFFIWIFGATTFLGVLVANLLSSVVSTLTIYDLGRRWFGENQGRVASLLFALWPMGIQFSTVLASELHFIALATLALCLWDRCHLQLGSLPRIVCAGLSFTAATYVRPIALLLPIVLASLTTIRQPRKGMAGFVIAAIITGIMLMAIEPWARRNERVLGQRALISTNFWPNFWMGNHSKSTGEYTALPPETDSMNEIERSKYMRDLAIRDVTAHPVESAWRFVIKCVRLHDRETIGVVWNEKEVRRVLGDYAVVGLKVLSTAYWLIVVLSGLAGFWTLWQGGGAKAALFSYPFGLWMYLTVLHAIIVVGDRYHMPAFPFIAILAGVFVAHREVSGPK